MTLYYAASTKGFYSSTINGEEVPGDAVEITEDQYAAALSRGADETLSIINGELTIVGPTAAQMEAALRSVATAKAQVLIATAVSFTANDLTLTSDVSAATLADWMTLQQWAVSNSTATTQWVANDGTVTALPASSVNTFATQVGLRSQAIWQALATVLDAIVTGGITTTAEIEAATWPAST